MQVTQNPDSNEPTYAFQVFPIKNNFNIREVFIQFTIISILNILLTSQLITIFF